MGIRYEVVGYDKYSEDLVFTEQLPLGKQRIIAQMFATGDGMGKYILSSNDIRTLNVIFCLDIEPDKYNYYLSPYYVG